MSTLFIFISKYINEMKKLLILIISLFLSSCSSISYSISISPTANPQQIPSESYYINQTINQNYALNLYFCPTYISIGKTKMSKIKHHKKQTP